MLRTLKITSPEFESILTPSLLKLARLFHENNYELRVAGGAVRDILMGIVPHDIDFATTATPDQMKAMFQNAHVRMINANGEKHGTITARIDDTENFEITTLRIDLVTDGRHAVVQFTQDWLLDANRRDLTINALFLDLHGNIYDYFDGINDLERRRIRFVGDPVQRIQEDYLRILRYFRFFGRLAPNDAEHEDQTLKAISDNAHGLENIAGERLWLELKRIAEGRNAGPVLKVMLEQNIGPYLGLPKTSNIAGLVEHWKLCGETKPAALTILMHLFRDNDELEVFEKRMKYSNDCRKLSQLILNQRDLVSILGPDSRDQLKSYKDLLIDTMVTDTSAKERIIELLKYQHHFNFIKTFSEWNVPRFPISGEMLASKGIKQGPQYRLILDQLREAWKSSYYEASELELLDNILPRIVENLPTSAQIAADKNQSKKMKKNR